MKVEKNKYPPTNAEVDEPPPAPVDSFEQRTIGQTSSLTLAKDSCATRVDQQPTVSALLSTFARWRVVLLM